MRSAVKVPNRYKHNYYGFCAIFKFFGKRFSVPLETEGDDESRFRIDVLASQLEKFFEEPRDLIAPHREDHLKSVVMIETVLDDRQLSSGRFDPSTKDTDAARALWEGIPKYDNFRNFLHNVRVAQLKVGQWCSERRVDLDQVAIKRQDLKKRWKEESAARNTKASCLNRSRLDGAVRSFKNTCDGVRNLALQMENCRKGFDRLENVQDADQSRIRAAVDKFILSVHGLDGDCKAVLDAVNSAASKNRWAK